MNFLQEHAQYLLGYAQAQVEEVRPGVMLRATADPDAETITISGYQWQASQFSDALGLEPTLVKIDLEPCVIPRRVIADNLGTLLIRKHATKWHGREVAPPHPMLAEIWEHIA